MTQMASSNTILQTIVDEDKRGRVMSFYATAFLGFAPIGALSAGGLAELFGAPLTVAVGVQIGGFDRPQQAFLRNRLGAYWLGSCRLVRTYRETEAPSLVLLERRPYHPEAFIISPVMWRNIGFQST